MGMSLDIKANYGWHIGSEENLEVEEGTGCNDEGYLDVDAYTEKHLKKLKLKTAQYSDDARFFLSLKEEYKWDGEPIKLDTLPKIALSVEDFKLVQKDLKTINEHFNVELKGLPDWWFAPQYF